MPRVHDLQASFNAGEFTPRLAARSDFTKFKSGLETCTNLVPLAEGGATRRSGSRYVAEVKDSTVKGRLKKFQFSTSQSYVLELGNQAMRFYRHQGQITVGDTDAAIANGTFTSNITDWDDRSTGGTGNQISHDSTNGRLTLETNGTAATDIGWAEQDVSVGASFDETEHVLKFQVIGAPSDKIELRIGTTSTDNDIVDDVEFEVGYHCYAFTPGDGNNTIYIQFRNRGSFRDKDVQIDNVSLIDNSAVEIDTPYAEADLYEIQGPQSADVLYLFHVSYPTYKLVRNGHTSWSLVEVAWEDGPYLDENDTATTLLPSAASGLGINLTLSATTGVNDDAGWQSTDVGRLVRYSKNGTAWGYAVIVSITSTTVAVADVRAAFTATPTAQASFRLGAWSGTTGYPSVGAFFEQRLYAASTTKQPQTFWASQTGDFENMTPDNRDTSNDETVEADDALNYTISADNVNAIRWMSAGEDTLAIGTSGGEWVPSSETTILAPTENITVRRQTTHGSAQVEPVRVDNIVLFVQAAGRKVREFGFAFEVDGYQAFDMTRLASHITRGGIVEMDYAEELDSLVWLVRDDGKLLSMTFRREEDVVGWARHIFGGGFYASMTKVWQVDGTTFVDETTDANSSGNADWTIFPSSEAAGDYAAIGFTKPFTKLVFDYANGTAGVGGAVTWEYWNGSAWTALTNVTDNTTGFTASVADTLSVSWTEPTDWAKRVLSSGKSLYYVRAKIDTVYTTNPVLDQGFIVDDPVVESVTVIPGANGAGQTQDSSDRDEVWVICKRTINGVTKRFVEFLERDYEDGDDQEDVYYADSLLTYDSSSTTTITGLSHLEGETVKVLADGAVHPDKTVSSGQITLDSAASVVQVGLGYKHRLKPLKIDAGNPAGTALGKTKKIYGLTFFLLDSHTLSFGASLSTLENVEFRVVEDSTDAPAPLFTGEKSVEFDGDYDTAPRIIIESDDPVPFTLLAIAPKIQVNAMK